MDFDLTGRDDQRQALFGANLQAFLDRPGQSTEFF